ncbi:MAG: hypothetical protein JHC26_02700 [Thermofilum sp.]|uniref:hypothetical protein n=1 Tax=Thermofilum sp. TaxID=1961369 RepID=UPI00258FD2CD|nr:hypothetical protein [Thermofilum sp.]MCI4407975.1 hypothetical protein [Thermofilum sp.]
MVTIHGCGLTIDESMAMSTLLARANGFLNGREVYRIEKLSRSKKTCMWNPKESKYGKPFNSLGRLCGKPAKYRVTLIYGRHKFSVYLCDRHYRVFMRNAVKMAKELVKEIERHVEGGLYA